MIAAGALRGPFDDEVRAAASARARGDDVEEWHRLERAHIVGQPSALLHVASHVHMIRFAMRRRDGKELLGQTLRIAVAGPASALGRYPVGNTGGARVPATRPMSVPEDLAAVLAPYTRGTTA